MKKVMFVVVLMLVASTCFAQLQSGPSNVVGYVKVVCSAANPPGQPVASTSFGLPFKFWDVPSAGIPTYGAVSTNPSDIVGDQSRCGNIGTADLIVRQDGGLQAYRNGTPPACVGATWAGSLETGSGMIPGKAYWYKNKQTVAVNLVLAGEVDNAGNYYSPDLTITQGATAFTPISWRDSRSINRSQLNLLTSGFNGGTGGPGVSDRIAAQVGGGQAYLTGAGAWAGSLVTVEPGNAYWIHNRVNGAPPNPSGAGTYTYEYVPGGALAGGIVESPRLVNPGTAKISPTPATKVKAGTAN